MSQPNLPHGATPYGRVPWDCSRRTMSTCSALASGEPLPPRPVGLPASCSGVEPSRWDATGRHPRQGVRRPRPRTGSVPHGEAERRRSYQSRSGRHQPRSALSRSRPESRDSRRGSLVSRPRRSAGAGRHGGCGPPRQPRLRAAAEQSASGTPPQPYAAPCHRHRDSDQSRRSSIRAPGHTSPRHRPEHSRVHGWRAATMRPPARRRRRWPRSAASEPHQDRSLLVSVQRGHSGEPPSVDVRISPSPDAVDTKVRPSPIRAAHTLLAALAIAAANHRRVLPCQVDALPAGAAVDRGARWRELRPAR